MAELESEATNLFEEFFNPKPSLCDETADVGTEVNNVEDLTINKQLQSGNTLKTSVLSHSVDNGLLNETEVSGSLMDGSTSIIPDSVTRNNIENLKKRTDSSNNSTNKKIDNRTDNTSDDDHNNTVNGSANAVVKNDGKQKKAISFPKDTFISGYFEPPDPWKNAPLWTTEELVAAYKKSCETHGTKANSKLIQQLQAINSTGKREEVLSLKGEKLDQKQCECIEEILRRVQFKLIDLEASHLDDECAVALFDMIEYYESACQLNISFNKNIQARGWQACSRLVRRTPSLTYLDIRNCDLNDRTIPIFGRALKLGCHLTILHMESMNLSGRPLAILVAALKMNETLQELFLAENKLMPTDGVHLGNLLRYNNKLSLLDLRNNHLQDVGTSHICDGLVEQTVGRGLHTLVLWNNAVNYQAMPALGRALAATESLETLNIGHNSITNEGVHLLKDGLLKSTSLLRLGLQGTKISDEGAVALAEYIADSTILLRIDLRDNDIKTGGLMALSHAMRVNISVTRIDLDKESKKESGMKDYAEQQSRLLRDILTFQQRNVQTALEKEEQERVKLEEKAKAAAAKRNSKDSSPPNGGESFTVIEEEEATDKDVGQEKEKKDTENAKMKNEEDKEKENEKLSHEEDSDNVDGRDLDEEKEDVKLRPRPGQLFPYVGIPPQESLDSPLPTSNDNLLFSAVSAPQSIPPNPPKLSLSETGLTTLRVGSAPAEMILSPQYFPKQIARKIFSVSRVTEDPSWSHLSTSPTPPIPLLSAAFDPLSVSSVPLVSSSAPSSFTSSSSPMLVPKSVLGLSHSQPHQPSISPSSLLFQDLADETVKHMVSPDIDTDVKSLLAKNVGTAALSNAKDTTKANAECTKKVGTEIHGPTIESDTNERDDTAKQAGKRKTGVALSSTELSNRGTELLQHCDDAVPEETLLIVHGDVDSCDTSVVVVERGDSVLSEIVLAVSAANSGDSSVVVSNSQKEVCKGPLPESYAASVKGLLHSENTGLQGSSGASDEPLSFNSAPAHVDRNLEGSSTTLSSVTTLEKTTVGSSVVAEFSQQQSSVLQFAMDIDTENTLMYSDCNKSIASFSHHGAGDDFLLQPVENPEKDEFQQQGPAHTDLPVENSTNSDVKNHNSLCSITAEEAFSVCKNNSNSPSVLLPEDSSMFVTDLADSFDPGNATVENSVDSKVLSSLEDLLGLDFPTANPEVKGGHEAAKCTLSNTHVHLASSDAADAVTSVSNTNCDHIDIENVDLSLDEEPWFAVGADTDGSDTEKTKEPPKQPDFFTTLTMNGLTQELASALTSFDGTSTCYGDEEDELDLRPHDEFERELDALLAVVQSDLPWPLKDS